MSANLITFIILIVAFLSAAGAKPQQVSCVDRTIPVNALDDKGVQITNLKALDLQARLRGKPTTILSLTEDSGPRRILILLDASGSMTADTEDKWRLALKAANNLVTNSSETPAFSLIIFTDKVQETLGFEQGRDSIAKRLKELSPGKKALPKKTRPTTALWDAISAGADILGSSNSGDVIYAITDGGDNASNEKEALVERKLLDRGIRLFGFFFDERSSSDPDVSNLTDTIGMADDTGGDAIAILPRMAFSEPYNFTKDELLRLDQSQQTLFGEIAHFYRLGLALSQNGEKPEDLLLSFSHPKDQKWRGIHLRYPHKISPCSTSANRDANPVHAQASYL